MLTETLKNKTIEFLGNKTKAKFWIIVDPAIESTDCTVYRFSSSEYHHDIALKLYHPEKGSKKNAHYSAIKRFSGLLNTNNSKYRVPEPYALFHENDCFLMEWATGNSLQDKLWKHCLNKSRLQSHIKDAYHWLKHYHQNADLKMKQVDTSRYLTHLKKHIMRSNADNLSTNTIFKAGVDTLIKFEQSFVGFATLHADIHGDLNLSNIIIDDNHISGIDIGGMESLPVEDDIAQMLNYICINYFNMLTRFDMQKPQDMWEIFNVALDAYNYPKDKETRTFFLFVFLYQMLYRWVSVTNIHKMNNENTITFLLLGKWRLYNSSVIVKSLIKVINEKIK